MQFSYSILAPPRICLSCALADSTAGPSRCFPFWQELLACYVVNTNTDDVKGAKVCLPALEDYYECLHHRKEVHSPDESTLRAV